MDADQNNRENHVQSHQNQEPPILQLPPLLRNLPGLEDLRAADEFRAAIEESQREDVAAAFEAQAQALDGAPMASVTNGFPPHLPPPPPPPSPPPPPPQHRAAEGGNLEHHSARAAPLLELPPLLRNLPGLEDMWIADQFRAAIEQSQREDMAAFAAQAQAPDGAPMASVTNGFPPPPPHPPPPPPPPPPQHRTVEGRNLEHHSARAAPILQLPPLLRNLPGLEDMWIADQFRAAIEQSQRQDMAAFEAQAPDGAPMASVTNGFPPPPHRAAEGRNLEHHSARAAPTENGHPPPPPQYHAAEGGFTFDIGSDTESGSDVDDVEP